jgi:integrase/recombinase XerC
MWQRTIDDYTTHLQASGRSRETIRTRLSYLRRWARFCPDPDAATRLMAEEWLASHEWAPETLKSARATLVGFYGWREDMTGESFGMHRLDSVKVPRSVPRPASESTVSTGLGCSDRDARLMVSFAALCGLRRSEIARIRTQDADAGWLYVRGKGGRVRRVPAPPGVLAEMSARADGYVFPGGSGPGHLHPATVQKRVKHASGQAPHGFRHRYATKAYRGSSDLLGVQQLLGHSSPETTQRYVLMDDDRLRGTAEGCWEVGE